MARRSHIKGTSRLRRKLRRMPNKMTDELRIFVRKGAEQIRADAVRLAPELSGDLKDALRGKSAISITGDQLSAKIGIRTKRMLARVFYAHFVEFGTIATTAHPFLVPAFKMNIGLLSRDARKAINRVIARAAL